MDVFGHGAVGIDFDEEVHVAALVFPGRVLVACRFRER